MTKWVPFGVAMAGDYEGEGGIDKRHNIYGGDALWLCRGRAARPSLEGILFSILQDLGSERAAGVAGQVLKTAVQAKAAVDNKMASVLGLAGPKSRPCGVCVSCAGRRTAETADLPVAGVFEVKGGKITAHRDYFDDRTWLDATGIPLG